MRQILFVAGGCLFLFFSNALILNINSPTGYITKDIIACGPVNAGNVRRGAIDATEEIAVNDNREPAGEMRNGILYLKLETRTGAWYPETHDGGALNVYAFAEAGKSLQVPGPLIRVPEGTIINAEIHNTIPGSPLVLHGFYSHPGNAKDSITIASGDSYKVQFLTGKAGTYFYWATDGNLKNHFNGFPYFNFDQLPYFNDSQLYGAFIVDPAGTKPDLLEKIMMIGIWNDTLNGPTQGGEELAINGLSWPYTERLTYEKDKVIHWRLINASNQLHPMHLHGFYYTVNSRGNADTDNVYKEKDRYLAVTALLKPHQTISLTWTAQREGNWLFHCHTLAHISPGSFLRQEPAMTEEQMNDITTHARNGMGGLIMGITVLPSKNEVKQQPDKKITERALTLVVQEKKNYYDTLTGYGFVLREGTASTDIKGSIPGPPIILERAKPVAIKIINNLPEATTIHWHGLEIESYFDGVAGWGNRNKELAPLIMPGDSFIVHFTPPRAGTFMYHTHMHNMQLLEGMSGPLIVTEPGEEYNSIKNKIFFISQGGTDPERLLFLNGKTNTDSMTLKRETSYRFRIINITAVGPDLTVSVLLNGVPVKWRAIAEDGAEFPVQQRLIKPAFDQSVSIGKTMDFSFIPEKVGNYLFAVKDYQDSIVLSKVLKVQ